MTNLVPIIGTETLVDDTPRADGTVKQAIDRAPQVLPEAIARLVGWYLTRDYVVYQDDVANAVLAMPVPARPTLAETRTGHDWCPHCKTEAGTDRFAYAGVERCAVCSKALVPVPARRSTGKG